MQPGIPTSVANTVNSANAANGISVNRTSVWQKLIILGFVALAYFLAARLSLASLQLGIEASPIWPPAGIALAALLILGRWASVGVAVGVWWLNTTLNVPFFLSVGSVLSSTLQAVVGAMLLQRVQFSAAMERLKDVLRFVSLAVLIAPLVNATIGSFVAYWVGHLTWKEVAQNWWTVWLGDGMGILIFTPALLALWQRVNQGYIKYSEFKSTFSSRFVKPANRLKPRLTSRFVFPSQRSLPLQHVFREASSLDRPSWLEQSLWLSSLVVVSWAVFYSQLNRSIALYPLEYLPFPFVMWAALRFGQLNAILASFILSVIAISGTILGNGPFLAKAADPNQVILLLQAFIGVITITAMILAAVMATRQEAEAQLRLTAERNHLLSEMAMRIRKSLDLHEIMQTTVEEVRQFLQADRVFFSCFDSNGHGRVVAESLVPGWTSTLGWTTDAAVYRELQAMFAKEPIRVVPDTSQTEISPFLKHYHSRYSVRAGIAVPIILGTHNCAGQNHPFNNHKLDNYKLDNHKLDNNKLNNQKLDKSKLEIWCGSTDGTECQLPSPHLFGVLVVNQCSTSRQWQPLEIELLEQLGTQVAIAIQQGQLYQRVQTLNANLEQQVAERTLQLQSNMAELEELNQLRDVLIHAIAHDLRTTVMGSQMVLKNLQNQPGDTIAVPRTVLERMTHSGEIQLCKLNSLLEAYKNKTEGIVINPQELSLPPFIESILRDLRPLFECNQVNVMNNVAADLPEIWADSQQLERVFRHLLVNAVKHNPPGIQVVVHAIVEDDMLRCVVEDNGRGINPCQRNCLFDLRLGNAKERQLTGLSLGLYLCQQIVTAHGGRVGVNSEPGQGSSFWFTLPLKLRCYAP